MKEARANGYTVVCRTIEVGARWFMSKSSMHVFSLLGFTPKKRNELRKAMSKVAI